MYKNCHCEPATRLVGEPLGHELGAEWLKSCRSAESERSGEAISEMSLPMRLRRPLQSLAMSIGEYLKYTLLVTFKSVCMVTNEEKISPQNRQFIREEGTDTFTEVTGGRPSSFQEVTEWGTPWLRAKSRRTGRGQASPVRNFLK